MGFHNSPLKVKQRCTYCAFNQEASTGSYFSGTWPKKEIAYQKNTIIDFQEKLKYLFFKLAKVK